MSSLPDVFEDRDGIRENPRLHALTPLLELTRGEGYRWASIDVVDLDPPTWFPPEAAS